MPSRRSHQVTLARALSKLGVLSRTQARAAILAGRVAVDGTAARDPDRWLDPDRAAIALDGMAVQKQTHVYLALHKPAGILTTRSDERGRKTVYDLLPPNTPWLSPVGRLDQDSTGLLLLTNDTQFAAAVTGPEAKVPKIYEVDLDEPLTADALTQFERGMTLVDGTLLQPVEVALAVTGDRRCLRLTLREGKNRQIRRMIAECGREVVRLHRIAIGPVLLGTLPTGAVRPLTAGERQGLAKARRRDR